MLVLTRKENESVFIGDNVKVTILRAAGGRSKLGIEAPRDVVVLREEVDKHAVANDTEAEQ